MLIYYVHFYSNHGELYIQLKPDQDFMCVQIEYANNFLFKLKDLKMVDAQLMDLPDWFNTDFDFNRNRHNVREIYKLDENYKTY